MVVVNTSASVGSLRAERTEAPEVVAQAFRLAIIIREFKLNPSLGYRNTKHQNLVRILGWTKSLFMAIGIEAQEALNLAKDSVACNDAQKALGLNSKNIKLITSFISNHNYYKRFLGCNALALSSLPEILNESSIRINHQFHRPPSQRTRHH